MTDREKLCFKRFQKVLDLEIRFYAIALFVFSSRIAWLLFNFMDGDQLTPVDREKTTILIQSSLGLILLTYATLGRYRQRLEDQAWDEYFSLPKHDVDCWCCGKSVQWRGSVEEKPLCPNCGKS